MSTYALLFLTSILALRTAQRCPTRRCHCNGTRIDCSDAQLTDFPWTLPVETTELYLQRNNLTVVPPTVLRDLPRLRALNLADNRISTVNTEVVEKALQLDAFVLYGNPLHCSCEILPLVQLMKNGEDFVPREVFCHTPRSVAGKSLNQLDFSCGLKRTVRSLNQSGSGSGSGMESDMGNTSATPNASAAATDSIATTVTSPSITGGSGSGATDVFQLPSSSPSSNASVAATDSSPPTANVSTGTTDVFQLPSASSGSARNATDTSPSTDGFSISQQWFLLEFDSIICQSSIRAGTVEDNFRQNLVNTLNSNVCQECGLTINNTSARLHCDANAVLNVTVTLETARLPAGINAVNLTDYYLNDYLRHAQNRSSNDTIILTINGVAYSLKRFCSQSTKDCPIAVMASRPTGTMGLLTPKSTDDSDLSKEAIAIAVICAVSLTILWTIMIIWFYRNIYSKRDDKDTSKAKEFWDSMSPQDRSLRYKKSSTASNGGEEMTKSENWGWPSSV